MSRRAALFDHERERREASPSLALVKRPPTCEQGHPETRLRVVQGALFRHGGYGADQVREFAFCFECQTWRVALITEANPRAGA